VWQEMAKALASEAPWRFFEVTAQCGADRVLWGELELDTLAIDALKQAAQMSPKPAIRLAALLHHQPEESTRKLARRLRLPKLVADLVIMVSRYAKAVKTSLNAEPAPLLDLLEQLDVFRRPERFKQILMAIEASTHDQEKAARCTKQLHQAYSITASVSTSSLLKQGYTGLALRDKIYQTRLDCLSKAHRD